MALLENKVLIIKHLPSSLNASEKEDLLKYFGAWKVRVMPIKGRMKHTVFATFDSAEKAKQAVERLHQKEIFNSILSVEYAKISHTQEACIEKEESDKNEDDIFEKLKSDEHCYGDVLPPVAPHFGIKYPANPGLKYRYPAPNSDILINICSALLTVPRLYNQVLHLMNKMHLVPPFGPATSVPPILVQHIKRLCNLNFLTEDRKDTTGLSDRILQEPDTFEVVEMSESESEYESSDSRDGTSHTKSLDVDVPERVLTARKRKRVKPVGNVDKKKKRLKLVTHETIGSNVSATNIIEKSKVFEEVPTVLKRSMDIKVPLALQKTTIDENIVTELAERMPEDINKDKSDGFGKLAAQKISPNQEDLTVTTDDIVLKDYITKRQLDSGRLSKKEISSSSVYNNYQKGEPTCRLYIKNLSKQVTEKDLKFIFGRFVNFDDDNERNMFDVRVMTQGRMKGQAFVGLPTIQSATEALKATNGYQLINKPMVVHFARSSKPK